MYPGDCARCPRLGSPREGKDEDRGFRHGQPCLGVRHRRRQDGAGHPGIVGSVTRGAVTAGVPDSIIWRWASDQEYSAASAYGAMFIGSSVPFGATLIWRSRAPSRVILFFWLALHRRCWTAERRKRHGLQINDSCIMCLQASETLDHIVLGCVFSREVWNRLLFRLGLVALAANDASTSSFGGAGLGKDRACRKGFDSLVMASCWMLWKERNARTFRNEVSCVSHLSYFLILYLST